VFRQIDDNFYVAPQISEADIATAAAMGIALIINNRPDGEEPSAPQGDAIAAAAEAAGIAYVAIPVTHSGFSHAQIDALTSAMAAHPGPALAYCRSGTRSTFLWALAQARGGESADRIADKAAAGGYDVTPVRAMIDALSGG
jgi:uncharacterized protein (TIGR01244 family)